MRRLLTICCIVATLLLGSTEGWGADFQKGMNAYRSGDYPTAFRELEPLAEQGYADAQFYLGAMYYLGIGASQNYKNAFKWFKLAAKQGNAPAQSNLGVMYAVGEGVIQDNVRAHMWANLSALNGNENGAKLRYSLAKKMNPSQVAEAQKLALECVKKNYKGC